MTLTFARVILHTVMHHSSTSTYTPNFIKIEETFCGWKDVRTYIRTHRRTDDEHLRPALLGRLLSKSRPNKLEDELQCSNVDIDAYATSKARDQMTKI